MKIEDIINKFALKGNTIEIKENNVGNINKTYIITTKDEKEHKYVLQRINTTVRSFTQEPFGLFFNGLPCCRYFRRTSGRSIKALLSLGKSMLLSSFRRSHQGGKSGIPANIHKNIRTSIAPWMAP